MNIPSGAPGSKTIRKSQQRSPAVPSISSTSSDNSKSLREKKKTRSLELSKIVYEPDEDVVPEEDDDGWSPFFTCVLQVATTLLVAGSFGYHVVFERNSLAVSALAETLLAEVIASVLMVNVMDSRYTGPCCGFLAVQYFLLFFSFSSFLQSSNQVRNSFLEYMFSPVLASALATLFHLVILMDSMAMVGKSAKRDDFSDRLIVETKKKRAGDMFQMIGTVMTDATCADHDLNVDLTITDETGRPVKLGGAGVEAGVNRTTQVDINRSGRDVKLSSMKTAAALVTVPNRNGHQNVNARGGAVAPAANARLANASVYNNSQRQDEMLSPLKIL